MKKILFLFMVSFTLFPLQAYAVTFSITPSSQSILAGESFSMNLEVSGLTAGSADSLGAFALDVTFDDSIFSFDSVVFSNFLGNPDFFETVTYFDDSTAGTVYLDEVSWLFDYELDALQPDSFILATLQFNGVGAGVRNIELSNLVASDALGYSFNNLTTQNAEISVTSTAPIPEPATVLLLGSGLLGMIGFSRRQVS